MWTQVERDVRLVFENAMQFNAPDDQVHVMAEKMLKMFKSLWSNTNLVSAAASSSSSFGKPAAATKTKKPKNMFNKVRSLQQVNSSHAHAPLALALCRKMKSRCCRNEVLI